MSITCPFHYPFTLQLPYDVNCPASDFVIYLLLFEWTKTKLYQIYLAVVYVIHAMPINNITSLNFILNVMFIHFVFIVSFFRSFAWYRCVWVCWYWDRRACTKEETEKITNARQQEHDTHQAENKWLELSIRVPCDCCRVCVIVCGKNARTLVWETTALTTFFLHNNLKAKTFRNRFGLFIRALFSTNWIYLFFGSLIWCQHHFAGEKIGNTSSKDNRRLFKVSFVETFSIIQYVRTRHRSLKYEMIFSFVENEGTDFN